jgi:hypothetical protein
MIFGSKGADKLTIDSLKRGVFGRKDFKRPVRVIFRRKGAGYFRRNGATEGGHPGGSSLKVLGTAGNLAA